MSTKKNDKTDLAMVLDCSKRPFQAFHLPGPLSQPVRTVPGPCAIPAEYANDRFLDTPEVLTGEAAAREWAARWDEYVAIAQSVPGLRLAMGLDARPEVQAACQARIEFLQSDEKAA
jgi:hypothetical protein